MDQSGQLEFSTESGAYEISFWLSAIQLSAYQSGQLEFNTVTQNLVHMKLAFGYQLAFISACLYYLLSQV